MRDASVIVCSRDRPDLLADLVKSVLDGASLPREIVVVDQSANPNPRLPELAPPPGCDVRYLHRPGRGVSLARNIGLRAATADVAVLLDDDMLVEPAWLGRLLDGREVGNRRSVATGCVLAGPDEGTGQVVPPSALLTNPSPDVYRGRQLRDVVPGANVALDRRLVLELGGFDERLGPGRRYPAAEDNDLAWRLLEAGCVVRHVPAAIVLHRPWRSAAHLARLRWQYGRGKGAFYAKHLSLHDRFMLRRALSDVGLRLARALRQVVASPRTTASEVVYVAGVVTASAEWFVIEGRRGKSALAP